MTISGMVRMILPIIPATPSKGRNAATVVSTAKTTGSDTSCAPSIEPRSPSPCRIWCV